MALHLYTGSSGSGKSCALYREIIDQSIKNPKDRFFVIVPEQFSMHAQKELVRLHPRHGLLNIDVLSFNRLAHRVFDEVGVKQAELMEEIGKSFVLQKIALDTTERMSLLGSSLTKPGNIAEMKSVISELMLYGIKPEDLAGAEERKAGGKASYSAQLGMKLHDIELIYKEFRDYLDRHSYMTSEEIPDVLARVADRSEILKDSIIVLDGFTGFTPVQLILVEKLMKLCREMYVAVTLDARYEPFGTYRKTDLFSMSREMIGQLAGIACKIGVTVSAPVRIPNMEFGKPRGRFAISKDLAHLESNLMRRQHAEYAYEPEDIHLLVASNPLSEMREAAKVIARLVRERGLRYRDFAVITGDLGRYSNYVRQVFGEMSIPYFIDEKAFLLRNPFVEYLRAAVEVCADNYSYDSMFRMLRSGLSGLAASEIDILENHVLALGIRGKKKWRETWILHSRNEDPGVMAELNKLREKVLALIDPFADVMAKRGGTIEEKTAALYEFCARTGCETYLAAEADKFRESGRQDLARQYSQVFPRVMGFLDKLVFVLGDEKISMRDYRAILEAGFAEEKIGIIPPGTDQVLVGDMERSRLADVKVLFFVGLNEGIVPKPDNGGGMLTESDREALRGSGIRLKPTPRENISIGRFYMYLALTKPSLKLMLSYAVSDSSGEVQRPAYLVSTIRNLFPLLKEEYVSTDIRDNIERSANGLALLTEGFSQLAEHEPSPEFLELFSWYRAKPEYRTRTDALLMAASAHKPNDQIGRAVARALYGEELYNSASRLEKFASCQFAHYVQYGLALREREEYEFRAPDFGNIMHSALDRFGQKVTRVLLEDGTPATWATIDDSSRDALVEQCIDEAAQSYGAMILHDSARSEYQIRRMKRILKTSVWALQEQLKVGDFEPTGYEFVFNGSENLGATNAALPGGTKLVLNGRIDRVDICEADGVTYLKIVDYKTGEKKFDITAVYYGIDLQLIVYLNAASEIYERRGKTVEPAGIFYYRIKDPIVDFEAGDTEEIIRERVLADMKASGIISDDVSVLTHLDRDILRNGSSRAINVRVKKDGTPYKTSSTLDPDSFRLVSAYVDRKIRKIGAEIMEGAADMNPYEYGSRSACDFCSFKTMCGFDKGISGYRKRRIPKMNSEDVLALMADEESGNN